jgi:hypothetical protein
VVPLERPASILLFHSSSKLVPFIEVFRGIAVEKGKVSLKSSPPNFSERKMFNDSSSFYRFSISLLHRILKLALKKN